MNKLRKILLSVACFVFAISAVALVSTTASNYANADETPSFTVEQKTSVRKANDGYYGLQFYASFNGAWFNENVGKGVSATYGILVYPKANATTVEDKTIDTIVEETKAVQFVYSGVNFTSGRTITGAVVYNRDNLAAAGVPEEKLDDALNMYYAMEMEAIAYVQVGGEIIWADGSYSTSMRKTAALSVIADPDNKELYEEYYDVVGEVTPLIAKSVNAGKFYDLDVDDGAYELYTVDKKSIPVSVVDGMLTISDAALLQEMEVGEYEAFLFADGNDQYIKDNKFYKVKFVVADQAITTAEELDAAFSTTEDYTYYYALANDIDLEGYVYASSQKTLSGVFNGRGYSIKNFKWTRSPSSGTLFGYLQNGGVLKNVALTDFWDGGDYWGIAVLANRAAGCTIENVYVRPRPGINGFNAFGLYDNAETELKNVVLDYQPIDQELKADGTLGLSNSKNSIQVGNYQGLISSFRANCDNVYMVSPYLLSAYSFSKYSSTHVTDGTALEYEVYFASNDNEMPYLDTILNQDGSLTHTRVGFPEDIVTVLNNHNATLDEESKYVFDPNNLTVDDFIKYSEVDGNAKTIAVRNKTGVKRYNTFADMASDKASNNLSSFVDAGFWSVVDGCPVWHQDVSSAVVATVGGVEVNGSNFVSVGRGQTADVVLTYAGSQATINSITVKDTNKLTAYNGVLSGVANGDTSITVNYTVGEKSYDKVINVSVVNPIYVLDDYIVYDADTKSIQYDFDEEIISAYVETPNGNIEVDVTDGFAFTYSPESDASNILTVYISLGIILLIPLKNT